MSKMITARLTATGKISFFGGPSDMGVGKQEGLALFNLALASGVVGSGLFIAPVRSDLGLARQLNPDAYYCAMRWDYAQTPLELLLLSVVMVTSAAGFVAWCRPADWGPGAQTGRTIDVSWAAMRRLNVRTDDVVSAVLFCPEN